MSSILILLIILGTTIQSCESNETCDVINKDQCQFESTCKPLLFDIVLNLF